MGEMTVTQLAGGLWRWTVPHPEWTPESSDWDQIVGCVYCETDEAVVLVDPLVPTRGADGERFWRALDRDVERLQLPVAVLLTCRWHVRSAAVVRERYDADVIAPVATGGGFAGLVTDVVGDGNEALAGVRAFHTGMPSPEEEAVYWIAVHRALVSGDVLLGDDAGGVRLAPPEWFADGDEERAWYAGGLRESLRRLVALRPAFLLPAHGAPVTEGAPDVLATALGAGEVP
jgi:glyoxylase-like metal-dependent hydrolase (beta-lactamase superfamily II)